MSGPAPDAEVDLQLDARELRVLGSLIEKEATTPDNYPLTLNSLRSACNQSTSRDPVVAYGEREIDAALASLRAKGLTRTVHSTSNRATKYRHVLPDVLALEPSETALLSVLMLRGAQTVGELNGRTERQHAFASLDEVAAVLAALANRPRPLVRQLDRQPGHKDARWVHLLGAVVDTDRAGRPTAASDRPAGGDDPYGLATAEFYDLLATDAWTAMAAHLELLLADVDPSHGPIVDVGCGTGVGLAAIHRAVPEARIVAIEPSRAMRTALHARLHGDPSLRELTTVVPTGFSEATLPTRASAVVCLSVLGHLSDDERGALWSYVAEHLPAGAPAIVSVLPPDRPRQIPLLRYGAVPVGDHVYEGWQSAEPIDERSMRWTMIYKVLDVDRRVIAEHAASAPWRCDSVDGLRAEVAPHGLQVVDFDGCVVISRPVG